MQPSSSQYCDPEATCRSLEAVIRRYTPVVDLESAKTPCTDHWDFPASNPPETPLRLFPRHPSPLLPLPRLVFFSWVSFPWINNSNLGSTSAAYFFSDQRSTRLLSPILSTQIALRNLSQCTIPINVSLVYPVSRLYASLSSCTDFFHKLPVCTDVHRTSEPIQVHLQEWVSPIDHRPLSPTKPWKLTS